MFTILNRSEKQTVDSVEEEFKKQSIHHACRETAG